MPHMAHNEQDLQSACLFKLYWDVTHLHICAAAPCNQQPPFVQLVILQRILKDIIIHSEAS